MKRRYALAFARQDHLLAVEVQPGVCTPECPAWYRAKLYFEGLHAAANDSGGQERQANPVNGSDPQPVDGGALSTFLDPVKKVLSTRYAAVGILEEWETSMVLFDHALELPNYSWSRSSSHSRAKNKGRARFDDEKEDFMRTAWTDQRLKRSISLDLLLYEHAVGVYQQQLKDYGLTGD